jgi:hypothetical protein
VLLLLFGSGALAQSQAQPPQDKPVPSVPEPGQTTQKQTETTRTITTTTESTQSADEPKKHVMAVELYTKSALNNAKLVYETAELPQSPADKALWKEGVSNITRDIGKAQLHLSQLKKLAVAGKADTAKKEQDLLSHLRDAQSANSKLQSSLSRGDRAQIRDQASSVYTSLGAANDTLKDMQSSFNISLDQITPSERAPVRGTEPGTAPDKTAPPDKGMSPNKGTTPDTGTPDKNMAPERSTEDKGQPPAPQQEPAVPRPNDNQPQRPNPTPSPNRPY